MLFRREIQGDRMSQEFVLFERISYRYESMPELLLRNFSVSFPPGWTGIVGANGAGKTTVLKLACRLLDPVNGYIRSPEHALYCEQRADHLPAVFPSLLEREDIFACRIKGQLGVELDWASRWNSLSHGERKRAQIAVAIWQNPDVLALDEPTNHIDSDARAMLRLALREYRGIGLLVSHDRELLDSLCLQCLVLDSSSAVMRPGGYSNAVELRRVEQESRSFARQEAKREVGRLRTEAQNRARTAAGADRRVSKRGLARWDLDSRFRANRAMITGKDTHAGQLLRQMRGRVRRAEERLAGIRVAKEFRLGVELRGDRARGDFLIRLEAEELALGARRRLVLPDLAVCPDDRIGLVGRNGTGKSTLIRHLVSHDMLLLQRLTRTRWHIKPTAPDRFALDI
jgi:ATPase subunit of ABC transporter with duplicated ATPase domains